MFNDEVFIIKDIVASPYARSQHLLLHLDHAKPISGHYRIDDNELNSVDCGICINICSKLINLLLTIFTNNVIWLFAFKNNNNKKVNNNVRGNNPVG